MDTSNEPGAVLGFTEAWLSLGVVNPKRIEQLVAEFVTGHDPNPEHYRYAAFQRFLEANSPLSPEQSEALYWLGNCDPDPSIGGAMMADILRLEECPQRVIELALASGVKHLVQQAKRRVEQADRRS